MGCPTSIGTSTVQTLHLSFNFMPFWNSECLEEPYNSPDYSEVSLMQKLRVDALADSLSSQPCFLAMSTKATA